MAASPSRAPTRPPLLAPAVSALPVTLSILAVILGDADRLRQFFFDRSLWNDEVWVGLSVLTRSYGGLLRPLSGEQAAPPGWLWLERFCTQLFGNSELALRLPELLAALALPVLVAVLGHRFLGGWGWLPVAFVALSPYLVFYSAELKPYGPDATFTVLTILLTVCVLDHDLALPWLLWWGGVMAVVAFLSWPALVAVASSAVVIAFRAILPAVRQRRPAQLGWMAIANAPWLAVVAWQYQVILRPLRHNRPLQEFWASGYPSSIRALGSWLRGMIPAVVAQPLSLHLTWLVGVLVIVGATCLLIEQRLAALPMVLVLPVTFVAAALHLYPLEGPPGQPVLQQGRSALSLVPICLILVAGSVRAGALLSGLRRPGHLRTQAWGPLVAAAVAAGTVAATVVVAEPAMASAIGQFGLSDHDHRVPIGFFADETSADSGRGGLRRHLDGVGVRLLRCQIPAPGRPSRCRRARSHLCRGRDHREVGAFWSLLDGIRRPLSVDGRQSLYRRVPRCGPASRFAYQGHRPGRQRVDGAPGAPLNRRPYAGVGGPLPGRWPD